MSKNVAESERSQMTSQYDANALRAGLARHAHTHVPGNTHARTHARTHAQACAHRPIYNTFCSSTVTTVSWTRLIVTLYVHCLSCILLSFNSSTHVTTANIYMITSVCDLRCRYALHTLSTGPDVIRALSQKKKRNLVGIGVDRMCLLRGAFCPLTVYLNVLCGSENKQRLFHCTALTDWFS
jgi:hypothetical protein